MWFMFVFPECSTFLQSCLEKSPEARPRLETLRHSSWLRWSKQERERAPRRFADYCGPPWHSLFYCLFVCFVGPMGSRVRPCLVTVTSQQKGSGFKPDLPVRSLHFLPLYVGFLQAHWFLPQSEALMTKSDTKHEFYFTISPNVQNVRIDQIVFFFFFLFEGTLQCLPYWHRWESKRTFFQILFSNIAAAAVTTLLDKTGSLAGPKFLPTVVPHWPNFFYILKQENSWRNFVYLILHVFIL